MTALAREIAVKVYGAPAPKGSLKCVGRRGSRAHVLIEDNTLTKPWRAVVAQAGMVLVNRYGGPFSGPLGIEATVTLALAASIKPESRLWPSRKSPGHGDSDKLARTILDGLQDSRVFADDAQICDLHTRKVYPHTPGQLDALDRPGAFIRIYPL